MFSIKNVQTPIVALALLAIAALSSAPMGVALADEPILAPNPSFGNGWAFFDACGIPWEHSAINEVSAGYNKVKALTLHSVLAIPSWP